MAQTDIGPLTGKHRSNWIRLRTLILLRWVAIAGQLIALAVAQQIYGLRLEVGLCYFAVGISIIGNLIAIFIFPENKRLAEFENLLMVLFDLLQLAFLLFLTGGLNNPFALLLLGPVTISAAVLTARSTLLLCGTAIFLVTVLSEYHLPLKTQQGFILQIPDLFVFGNWTALVIAICFISAYSRRVTSEIHSMSDALSATQLALSREQKLTDLGGVVAAAAHELGTPLATIKLASAELIEELDNFPELREDASLINEQAERCRLILRDMGQAGKDDLHLRQAPLMTVIQEAAEPHIHRGKTVRFMHNPQAGQESKQPAILRQPEIIHGIRNLIQNAVDFARTSVWIECNWTENKISIQITDDGRGFPPHLLGRIGDPFIRQRKSVSEDQQRPEYAGMGLGLFIAKTLLERSGADLTFKNGNGPSFIDLDVNHCGAIIEVVWPRTKIDARRGENSISIDQKNKPIQI
ncbi:MAG: ActS/PrrB/RegB family redox-sensitive histidine kinase [Tateyamaria sp.]|nr:ActS/PrrB/RegB family redox-sensitive histidine kinase [Tateyamaria sp.]MBT5303436.1 ActS/PrrB/RegB family redox-sensitive histidine kinase [Tateyamaria sp.]MBT6266692.1 ActS/PrrB/RegB family redox-sensitive histidine kinase [Tateyamaria sp.]MBT6342314.1 ActS/PrrB/RegB family redox-sensitive histidine kinase [Tateyamaria sp.]MBT7446928.1 ActS/PrrB/RegB family redox-sensitive histidine kinase [Tateyamaria sp.]